MPRHQLTNTGDIQAARPRDPADLVLGRRRADLRVQAARRRGDQVDRDRQCIGRIGGLERVDARLCSVGQRRKVRYLGASNYTGWQLQKAIDLSRRMGWEPYACLQPQYNLLCRSTEWELVPVCLNEGLGVIPWSPLRGGWLSGKYRRGMAAPPPGTRVEIAEEQVG
jgi:diketogulonate reductase-like aldo/keto reductase